MIDIFEKHRAGIEIEINMRWAEENPDLFTKTFRKFLENHPEDKWSVSIKRRGTWCLILVAEKLKF